MLKPLDDLCTIKRRPDPAAVVHTRIAVYLAIPDVVGVFSPFNHHACSCNEEIAICNRVCGTVPHPSPLGLQELRVASKRISSCLPKTVPDDYGVLPNLYSGAKKRRYEDATRRVLETGITANDATITMFIKDERLNPITKINPDPRAIQFRDSKFCVEVARFLKPIEHHLYELQGTVHSGLPTSRLIGKGLNQVERAKLLKKKLSHFANPAILSLDASRFDQHVDYEVLKIEHSVYLRCCPDKHFEWLLSLQLVNRCFTKNGFSYVTHGKRMSGDMNTALGNCIIMVTCVIAFMTRFDVRWDILDDGDDCLLIIERTHLEQVVALAPEVFLSYGQEIKIEKIAFDLPSVSWCQSSPIEYLPGKWKFARDPFKTMSCDLSGSKWKCSLEARRRLLSSLGLCELILNLGVPILQSYALALIRSSEDAKPFASGDFLNSSLAIRAIRESKQVCPSVFDRDLKRFHVKHLLKLKPVEITREARVSFSLAFNMTIDEQVAIEVQLANWTVLLTGDAYLPESWNPLTWLDNRAFYPERYL